MQNIYRMVCIKSLQDKRKKKQEQEQYANLLREDSNNWKKHSLAEELLSSIGCCIALIVSLSHLQKDPELDIYRGSERSMERE